MKPSVTRFREDCKLLGLLKIPESFIADSLDLGTETMYILKNGVKVHIPKKKGQGNETK